MEALLRADAWPYGYTIGPTANLATLSVAERARQLLVWLPEFERLGWITPERRRRYEDPARRSELGSLRKEAFSDYAAERITSEVLAILRGLSGYSP
jgi:hypothetical protein